MKKNLFFSVTATMLLLTACSSDNAVSYDEAELIGKWYKPNHNTVGCEKDYVEFTAGHIYKGVHYVISPTGCIATDGIGNMYGQSWALNGNKITVTFGPLGGTSVMKIINLDDNSLTLKVRTGTNEDGTAIMGTELYYAN